MGLSLDDVAPEGALRRLRDLSARGDAGALEASCRDLCERLWAFGAPSRSLHEKLHIALRLFERTGSGAALASVGDLRRFSAPSRRFFFRRYRRYLRGDFAHRAEAERHLTYALFSEPDAAAAAFCQLAPRAPDAGLLRRLLACSGRVPAGVKLSYFRRIWHHASVRPVALGHLCELGAAGDAGALGALAVAEGWGKRAPSTHAPPPEAAAVPP